MKAVRRVLGGVPSPMAPGLVVLAAALAVDLAFHLAPFGWGEAMEGYLGGEGYPAHMGVMAGMVLTTLGLLAWGATGQPGARARASVRIANGGPSAIDGEARARETAASQVRDKPAREEWR